MLSGSLVFPTPQLCGTYSKRIKGLLAKLQDDAHHECRRISSQLDQIQGRSRLIDLDHLGTDLAMPFQEFRPGSSHPYRVCYPWSEVKTCGDLSAGETVEITRSSETHSDPVNDEADDWDSFLEREAQELSDFFMITSLVKNTQNGTILLRGYRLRPLSAMKDLLPDDLNEVYLVAKQVSHDDRFYMNQWLEEINLSVLVDREGFPQKRAVVMTNARFPRFSFRDESMPAFYPFNERSTDLTARMVVQKSQSLVCRRVCIDHSKEHDDRMRTKHREFRRLQAEEVDEEYRIPDLTMTKEFLGYNPVEQLLTFGDGFCGAGGVTIGARAAGFQPIFGFDKDRAAMDTWEKHNTDANALETDYLTFLKDHARKHRVTVLHLSYPCQFFSRANTQAGRKDPRSAGGARDDEHSAIIFSLEQFLARMRPRVVTLEETSGIEERDDHRPFLHAMMHALTSMQYSAAFKVVDMAGFGVPHHRKRLIIIASCIGTTLPSFPKETHGGITGDCLLQRYTTVDDCLRRVSMTHSDHEPRVETRRYPRGVADKMLKRGFTTGGTTEKHPTGRDFTVAECLALMTFPPSFSFPRGMFKTYKQRQIGNSVPPAFAEALMSQIKKSLAAENEAWSRMDQTRMNAGQASRHGRRPSLA